MGTIAEKLEYLNTTKAQLREAINNKGGSLTTSSPFRDYVNAVSAIPSTEQHPTYTGSYTATENGTLQTAGKAMTEDVVVHVISHGILEDAWNAWKANHPTSWGGAFACSFSDTTVFAPINLSSLDFSGSENVVNITNMFKNSSFKSVPLFNTSNVTTMNSTFYGCFSLTSVPLYDTSSVTTMESMFYNCSNLTNVPLFDTSSVTTMKEMFYGCFNFENVPLFNTSNVANMSAMFSHCSWLTSVPAFDTSNVRYMGYMFDYCSRLSDIPSFNTLNVKDMSYMFERCTRLTTVPAFDTSNVTDMRYMFNYCSSLTTVPAFDTSKVTRMDSMFDGCSNLETIHMHGMKVTFKISASTKFTREALIEIINNCADLTGGTAQRFVMGSTNLAKLTDEDKAIATNKNWTLL